MGQLELSRDGQQLAALRLAALLAAAAWAVAPARAAWTSVSAGGTVACGLQADQTAWCWGGNTNGELGNGSSSSTFTSTPVLVGGGVAAWSQLAAGQLSVCGVGAIDGLGAHAAWAWACAVHSCAHLPPTHPPTHTCALVAAYCWGSTNLGVLGDGLDASQRTQVDTPAPVNLTGPVAQVALGDENACAIMRGDPQLLYCWGSCIWGACGVSSTDVPVYGATNTPLRVTTLPAGVPWAAVAVGAWAGRGTRLQKPAPRARRRAACRSQATNSRAPWAATTCTAGAPTRLGNWVKTPQAQPAALSPLCTAARALRGCRSLLAAPTGAGVLRGAVLGMRTPCTPSPARAARAAPLQLRAGGGQHRQVLGRQREWPAGHSGRGGVGLQRLSSHGGRRPGLPVDKVGGSCGAAALRGDERAKRSRMARAPRPTDLPPLACHAAFPPQRRRPAHLLRRSYAGHLLLGVSRCR